MFNKWEVNERDNLNFQCYPNFGRQKHYFQCNNSNNILFRLRSTHMEAFVKWRQKNANIANIATAYTELHFPGRFIKERRKVRTKLTSLRARRKFLVAASSRHPEALRPTFPGGVTCHLWMQLRFPQISCHAIFSPRTV